MVDVEDDHRSDFVIDPIADALLATLRPPESCEQLGQSNIVSQQLEGCLE